MAQDMASASTFAGTAYSGQRPCIDGPDRRGADAAGRATDAWVRGLLTPSLMMGGGDEPLYTRLYRAIRDAIAEGRWPAGTRLPSTRLLAADLGIARGTASVAIDQLVCEGWLVSEARSGVFVAERGRLVEKRGHVSTEAARPIVSPRSFRDLSAPTRFFPIARWRQHAAKVWNGVEPEELLMSEAAGGHHELRDAVSRLLCGGRGVPVAADDVVICSSAHAAVEIAIRKLLPDGTTVAMESPGDPQLAARLRRAGCQVAEIPVDDRGLQVSRIPEGAGAVVVSPSVQIPSGVTMTDERRLELRAWARRSTAQIIELDCEGHLARRAGRPVPPIAAVDDGVIYIRDFDRVTYPGLNLAFAAVPQGQAACFRALRQEIDRPLPVSDQLILADFIASGGMAGHVRVLASAILDLRREALNLLEPYRDAHLLDARAGGTVLLLKVRPGSADAVKALLREARLRTWTVSEVGIGLKEDDRSIIASVIPASPNEGSPFTTTG